MIKTTTTVLSASTALITIAVLFFAAPSRVDAQTAAGPEYYFNATFGAQPQRRTVLGTATATIFNETAEFTADHRVGNGPFFDIAAGQRLTSSIIVGLSFSSFSSKGTAAGTASIPDPLFVGRPAIVGIQGSDLKRGEQFINLRAVWFRPLSKKIDLAVAAGPSVAHVKQQFLSGALTEGTENVVFIAEDQSGWGFGLNADADITYLLTPKYGIGLLLRYAWAKVGLDAADVTAGGFQGGLGIRVRF